MGEVVYNNKTSIDTILEVIFGVIEDKQSGLMDNLKYYSVVIGTDHLDDRRVVFSISKDDIKITTGINHSLGVDMIINLPFTDSDKILLTDELLPKLLEGTKEIYHEYDHSYTGC